jgi:hypothetical protein
MNANVRVTREMFYAFGALCMSVDDKVLPLLFPFYLFF